MQWIYVPREGPSLEERSFVWRPGRTRGLAYRLWTFAQSCVRARLRKITAIRTKKKETALQKNCTEVHRAAVAVAPKGWQLIRLLNESLSYRPEPTIGICFWISPFLVAGLFEGWLLFLHLLVPFVCFALLSSAIPGITMSNCQFAVFLKDGIAGSLYILRGSWNLATAMGWIGSIGLTFLLRFGRFRGLTNC